MAAILNIDNLDSLSTTSPRSLALFWMPNDDPLRDELMLTNTGDGIDNRSLMEQKIVIVLYFPTNNDSIRLLWADQL